MAVPRRIQIDSAFASLYLIWGSTYLGILFAIQSIPPFLMAGARFLLAGMIMFAIARTQGPLRSTWAEWRTALIVGACLLLGGNGGVTLSEKVYRIRARQSDCRDCPDLHHFARLVVRYDSATGADCLARTGRRISWRCDVDGSRVTIFRR